MAGTDTIVGTSGLMPEDLYLRKMEASCVYESPSLINDYNRNELKKEGPVQGFFESDQKRTNYDTKGRLALREHGKRTKTEPWLPDGTFLDHQFATKDPRSIMYGPDMLKHKEQQYARGGYYNYRSDEDYSIPEIMIHPEVYRQKIRETQQQAKDRMNIFDTSQVGWHTGGGALNQTTKPHGLLTSVTDNEISEAADFTSANRTGSTTALSNSTPIGWRQSVDHRFKVAHYGQKRGARSFADQDFYKNRGSTKYDQESDYTFIEDSPVPRPTAQTIADLSEKRLLEIEGASYVKLGKSEKCKVMKRRLTQDDMNLAQAKFVQVSQKRCAHDKLDQMQGNNPGNKMNGTDTAQRHTVIKSTIVEKMAASNKTLTPIERDDLRNHIKQSAKDGGVYMTETNNSQMNAESLDPMQGKYNAIYNFKRGSEKTVHVYGAGKGKKEGTDLSRVSYEQFASESHKTDQRRGNLDPYINPQKGDTEYDTHVEEFMPHNIGKKGAMNDKAGMRYMNVKDHSMHDDDMSEMNSRTSR
jgi:hypothetical protein